MRQRKIQPNDSAWDQPPVAGPAKPEDWEGLETEDFPGADDVYQEMAQMLDQPARRPILGRLVLLLILALLVGLAYWWSQQRQAQDANGQLASSQTPTATSAAAKKSPEDYWNLALTARERGQFYESARLLLLLQEQAEAGPELQGKARQLLREIYAGDLNVLVAGLGFSAAIRPDGSVLEHGYLKEAGLWQQAAKELEKKACVSLALTADSLFRLYADGTVGYQTVSEQPEMWKGLKDWQQVVSIQASEGLVAGLVADGHVRLAGPEAEPGLQEAVAQWTDIRHIDLGPGVVAAVDTSGRVHLAGSRASQYQDLERAAGLRLVRLAKTYAVAVSEAGQMIFSGRPDWLTEEVQVQQAADVLALDEQLYILDAQGKIQSYGINTDGQLAARDLEQVMAIAAASQHMIALQENGRIQGRGAELDTGKRVYVNFSEEEKAGLPLLRRLGEG